MWHDPDNGRFDGGMATERLHPWHGEQLEPQPIRGIEGIAGAVAVIHIHSEDGGMTYEMTEPVAHGHHRPRSSGTIPGEVRSA